MVEVSVGDIGVREGDDAADRPEKPSSGSSELVCEASIEWSIAVAKSCMFFRPPSENKVVRHSSVIGLGVIEPEKSSCESESSSLSKEKVGAAVNKGEDEPPNSDGESEARVLPLVSGGVDVAPAVCLSWNR